MNNRLTFSLGLWVDGQEIEHLDTALWMERANAALEAIFPDEEYWNINEPKTFDFIANEEKAKKVMQDYLEKIKNHERKSIYIADGLETRNKTHLVSPAEKYTIALGFVEDFFRAYNVGIVLQRQKKEVKVSIS